MLKNALLRDFKAGFSKLNEDNKKYVLAISRALIFAQTIPRDPPPDKEETTHGKSA